MSWSLAEIYRHPVKSLGQDPLEAVTLEAGKALPFDRAWAISHGATEWKPGTLPWETSGNWVTQTHVPRMAQITTRFDEAQELLNLSHPDLGEVAVRPGQAGDHATLTDWLAPLTEGTVRQGPFAVCSAPGIALTDFEDTHVSIATLPSRRALSELAGQTLEPVRFRMNLWIEGPRPWEDLEWVGQELQVGTARLKIIGRDERCNATAASPRSGARDVNVPALLHQRFSHRDFGVYAQVVQGGTVALGDPVRLLA